MNNHVRVRLQPDPVAHARLRALQELFADGCNQVALVAQQNRCWNRVALHHLAYRGLREAMPQLGSQMSCNVIFAVSRACRAVYQGQGSPFNVQTWGHRTLPRVSFESDAPVYFDKHTLSMRDGRGSIYTLDGRMRFDIGLSQADELRFHTNRIREITLSRRNACFVLDIYFAPDIDDRRLAQPSTAIELRHPVAGTAASATVEPARIADNPEAEPLPRFIRVCDVGTTTPVPASPGDKSPATRRSH